MGVYEFSHLFPGQWGIVPIFIVPGVLVCILLLMPFAARYLLGHMVNVAFTVVVLIAVVAMSWISLAKDRANPAYRQADRRGRAASRARVRVGPTSRAFQPPAPDACCTTIPKPQGPRLFTQHCASCHSHAASDAGRRRR